MKKLTIRRVGVSSFATFIGAAQAIWAFIFAFFAMFAGFAVVFENDDLGLFGKIGATVAVAGVALVVVPVIAFLIGWLYGAVVALIANVFLQAAKGIELDVEEGR